MSKKISMHYGYAEQLARITRLLEEDSKRSGVYDNMLYVTEVKFAVEGDDHGVARLKYDPSSDSLAIVLDPDEWNS